MDAEYNNDEKGYYPTKEEIILYLESVFSGKHKEAPEFKKDYTNIFIKDNTVRDLHRSAAVNPFYLTWKNIVNIPTRYLPIQLFRTDL